MNSTIELMLKRRSTRKYLSDPIPADLLEQIVQCGLYAPSGGNHQYTRLVVMQDTKRLELLNSAICDAFRQRELDPSSYQNKSVLRARQENCHFFFHAPALISAISLRDHCNSMADCANALENMQIACAALGLGSCWVNQPHWLTGQDTVRRFFTEIGMKPEEDIFGSIVVGMRDCDELKPLPRKEGRLLYDNIGK